MLQAKLIHQAKFQLIRKLNASMVNVTLLLNQQEKDVDIVSQMQGTLHVGNINKDIINEDYKVIEEQSWKAISSKSDMVTNLTSKMYNNEKQFDKTCPFGTNRNANTIWSLLLRQTNNRP